MKWKQYFKLPFKLDEYGAGYVWDANNQMVIDFPEKSPMSLVGKEIMLKIINADGKINSAFQPMYYKNGSFYIGQAINGKDTCMFQLRGWGYLTSPNCCNLSSEEACKVQDELGEYILKLLN